MSTPPVKVKVKVAEFAKKRIMQSAPFDTVVGRGIRAAIRRTDNGMLRTGMPGPAQDVE
jgi:hypothetical protein